MSGTFTNIFTVGRDFLFEVSYNRIARILGFSLKSIFTLAANYIGPWIGVNIYRANNNNFSDSCVYISMFFFIGTISFFIFFNIFKHENKLSSDQAKNEEE